MADWLKDGKPLPIIGSSRRIVLSLGRLTINSIRREDSGNYTCTLVNTAGSVTKSAMVVVEGKCSLSMQHKSRIFCRASVNIFLILKNDKEDILRLL